MKDEVKKLRDQLQKNIITQVSLKNKIKNLEHKLQKLKEQTIKLEENLEDLTRTR